MKASSPSKEKPERDIEGAIGLVLRYGVIVSSLVIVVGVLMSPFAIGAYQGCPATLDSICSANVGRPELSLSGLLAGIPDLNPLCLIEVGVLVLLAIPFFRVAAGGIMFVFERDWRYVAISVTVLVILLIGTFVVGPFEAG